MENIINTCSTWTGQLPPIVWGISMVTAAFGMTALIIVLIIWTIVWKGLALWRSARLGHKWWFIVFLIINTVGLLEIIYYFLIAPKYGKKK